MKLRSSLLLSILFLASAALAQSPPKFSHEAQKAVIPEELGKVYLGMPVADFAKAIDISKAEAPDPRFADLDLVIPFNKGSVNQIVVKIHGLSRDEINAFVTPQQVEDASPIGGAFTRTVHRVNSEKIPQNGFVYVISLKYDPGFDLAGYGVKKYGRGTPHDPSDDNKFYDMQWVKTSKDGLKWLIRSTWEGDAKTLQLIGRIDGTAWGLDDIN